MTSDSRLYQEERLHSHPLFELARSDTSRVVDRQGASTRINTSDRDDPETPNPQAVKKSCIHFTDEVQFSEIRTFQGQGRSLGQERISELKAACVGAGGALSVP